MSPWRRRRSRLALAWASLLLSAALRSDASDPAGRPRVLASVHDLFRPPALWHATLSPSGRYSAVIYGDADEIGNQGVIVQDVESGQKVELVNDYGILNGFWIEALYWEDEDSLIVEHGPKEQGRASARFAPYDLYDFDSAAKEIRFVRTRLHAWGVIVDASPGRSDEILFAPSTTQRVVYRTSPRFLKDLQPNWYALEDEDDESFGAGSPVRAATLEEDVSRWLADGSGVVRAAVSVSDRPVELRIWYREDLDARWEIVRRERNTDRFDDVIPLGFAADGKKLLVASALDRDRYGLYEYDPSTNRLGALLYEHPSAEIVGLVYDSSGNEPLAAVYIEDGEHRYAYLNPSEGEIDAAIRETQRDSLVALTGISRNRRRVLLHTSDSDDPGGFVVLDLDTRKVTPIGRIAPWLDDADLAEVRLIELKSGDGLPIEAFLTLPPFEVPKPPLVVMSHGGPIGISDSRDFSGPVQYLARSGFAVLQVNYRGSGGYGRRFEKAGRGEWGRGIEDDIDAAVDHVVAAGWVDERRMCTVGGSYGGYSALMMVVRDPKRYRCAASLNGVTDIALMFNADEVNAGQYVVDEMQKIVGDPEKQYAEMKRYSPVYNVDRIEVPIYLAHGERDRRVDVDHTTRMRFALEFADVPVRVKIIPNMGHGFGTREEAIRYWLSLYDFLVDHLRD